MDLGFSAIMAHLVGDYLLQGDWIAKNKANPMPKGERPPLRPIYMPDGTCSHYTDPDTLLTQEQWDAISDKWWTGNLACFVHCFLYTLTVFLFCHQWISLGGLVICFVAHFLMDRFRLARKWMNVSGQKEFATGPLSPWSIVVVDNTIHLLTLYLIFAL